ncbi:MAG: hypothetical protein P4L46_12005 [Fimbriimonas sp.]|nr:hypothetical protein [Fimbriimonas sp.]
MDASLRSLLDGVFDYAGFFPPAKLEMPRAIDQYIRHIEGPEEWIAGRFVCTAHNLQDLARALNQRQSTPEIEIAVVGQITTDYDEWEFALERDAGAMTAFMNEVGDTAPLSAYEVRIPSHVHVESCLVDLRAFSEVEVYVELPWADEMDDSIAALAITEWMGAKARTGGVDAAAFPDPESLAGFIHASMHLDVPIKLTAGLHHPFPTIDEATGGRMHGFINVLTASLMVRSHDFARKELVEVLRDDDPRHWRFGSDSMAWKSNEVSIGDIEDLRDVFYGIGSCSIEEPLADLAALGLAKKVAR